MKDFQIIEVEQLQELSRYKRIEEGIYLDLKDEEGFASYRIAMAMTLEKGEDTQYPLEDILDKYLMHVEAFLTKEGVKKPRYIFGGELDKLQDFKLIIGKRAYNEEFVDEEGISRVALKIE